MLFSVLVILEDYSGYLINKFEYDYSWFSVSIQALSTYLVWSILCPVMSRQAYGLLGIRKGNKIRKIFNAILVGLAMGLVHRFLYQRVFDTAYYFNTGFMAEPFSEKNMLLLGTGWITSVIQYWVILLLFFLLWYYQRYVEKQKELSRAQLQALKMQLHPHFLFNTLHSISALIDINHKAAQKMLSQLGGLMRNTLEQEDKEQVTLKEEIAYIKNYLDIERVRFQDRLEVKYEIETAVEGTILPYLIFQPLIENAIKHGIQEMQEEGQIMVSAALQGNRVLIEVVDNGVGSLQKKEGTGLGLRNVKNRLSQFFDGDFNLNFRQIKPQGFKVSIEVPYIEHKQV